MYDIRSDAQRDMVERQIAARGVRDHNVLRAMHDVRREDFVPSDLVEFAYDDEPLPIGEEQTISQPYVVALMLEALELKPDDRVLDVGTGSGYAAAAASRIARSVFGIERHARLARAAAERCRRLGFANVRVRRGDGTLGWPEEAPFDAIMVGAGGPDVPAALRSQLAVGGRLVIPVGPARVQQLLRVRRTGPETWVEEDLGPVRFVPLIGQEGWATDKPEEPLSLSELVAESAEPFESVRDVQLDALLARIGNARVVALGEATHGTAEFYDMRARITRELIERKGFTVVALEADWPEAQRLDRYVRGTDVEPHPEEAFDRFPRGQLAREHFGEDAYLIGFGTDHGTVAAAHDWDGEMEVMQVRPSHERSYERVCHDSGVSSFLLPLRSAPRELRKQLAEERLERAIGVIYRPRTELQSHYFHCSLPWQFDEWVWFDETRAVDPLDVEARVGMPQTFPFAV